METIYKIDDASAGASFVGVKAAGVPACESPADVVYRIATISAVIFLLATML